MERTAPPPLAPEGTSRYGGWIQVAVVALVLVVCAFAVLRGGREAPDIVRAGGPFADSFDAEGSLGPAWELPLGEIEASGGAARIGSTSPDEAAIAVRRHGVRPRTINVVLAGGGDGAGLLLGYRDPGSYWAIVASPATGTWTIIQFEDGAERARFTTEPSPTTPGTTVRATVDDDVIEVSIDGGPEASVRAPGRLPASDGLISLPGAAPGAAWDGFEVLEQ